MGGTGRTLLTLSLSSTATRFSFSLNPISKRFSVLKPLSPPNPSRVYLGFSFRPLCSTSTATTTPLTDESIEPMKHSILLERLRIRHLKESAKTPQNKPVTITPLLGIEGGNDGSRNKKKKETGAKASTFEELGLSEEVIGALVEMGISVPTEIQCIGVPAVLGGKSVVLGSHTGSGKTLAYMLPLAQVHFIYIPCF